LRNSLSLKLRKEISVKSDKFTKPRASSKKSLLFRKPAREVEASLEKGIPLKNERMKKNL